MQAPPLPWALCSDDQYTSCLLIRTAQYIHRYRYQLPASLPWMRMLVMQAWEPLDSLLKIVSHFSQPALSLSRCVTSQSVWSPSSNSCLVAGKAVPCLCLPKIQ